MTPEQIEIRELKKNLQRVGVERDILKKTTTEYADEIWGIQPVQEPPMVVPVWLSGSQ